MRPFELTKRLDAGTRRVLEKHLVALVRWSATLARWPRPLSRAPDAVPFVSLYAEGDLVGCFGADEGGPGERIARAFLRAQSDPRTKGITAPQRAAIVAQLSYLHSLEVRTADEARTALVPGIHGVALQAREGEAPVLLLPHVAGDAGLDGDGMVRTLFAKANRPYDGRVAVVLFETDDVVARRTHVTARGDEVELARAWLARAVDADGGVRFAFDPRARRATALGPFHHGRAAIVASALGGGRRHARVARLVRERLAEDIAAALRGRTIAGFPDAPAEIAGTLALAVLGGVDLSPALARFVRSKGNARSLESSAWHAAQVVCALGAEAPPALLAACVRDLDVRPWAPWTVLAARLSGDAKTARRATRALVEAPISPQCALAALTVEALADDRTASSKRCVARTRAFLRSQQLVPGRIRGALEASPRTVGAFPLTTIDATLRSDVTAHAVRALARDRA